MAGKRRAEPARRTSLPAWLWGAAAVACLVLLAWFTLPLVLGEESPDPAKRPTSSPTSSTPSPSESPTTSAPPAPPKLPALSPDQPRQLTIAGLIDTGFDDAVSPSGGTLHPASTGEVSRWAERGSPGSPGEDAVVVIGAMDPADSATSLSRLGSVKVGTQVRLRTDQGTLVYTVRTSLEVDDAKLLAHPEVTTETAGRLVLVGEGTDSNLVVVAVLTGVEPA